jgi:hypothetical protein
MDWIELACGKVCTGELLRIANETSGYEKGE